MIPSPEEVLSEPQVSVCVSTYGRAPLLPRLAAALSAQTLDPQQFEVVVVDDGSVDDTGEVLARLAAESPFTLRIHRQDNRGAAAGRNVAWRAARAPIVAFTDDDCRPQPQWLEAGIAALLAGARVVVGRTIPDPEEAHLLHHPFARSLSMEHGRFFQTANAFYRRDDLEAVDGFDEGFTTGEDTDLGLRVVRLGGNVVFTAGALVHHRVATTDLVGAVRGALRWADLPLVIRRHPSMRRELVHRVFWKRTHPPALLAVAGVGATLARHPALGAVLVAPWIAHRLGEPSAIPWPRRAVRLPGALVVDVAEVTAMVVGSLRHRVLVL